MILHGLKMFVELHHATVVLHHEALAVRLGDQRAALEVDSSKIWHEA